MDFKEAYNFPLKYDPQFEFMVTGKYPHTAFNWACDWLIDEYAVYLDDKEKQEIVDHLNSGEPMHRFNGVNYNNSEPCKIRVGDTAIITVRGWGYMTGTGGLNLDTSEAIKLQDEFRDYIIEILKK